MTKIPLITEVENSHFITGDGFINKMARISYFTGLSFRELEQITLQFDEDKSYLVQTGKDFRHIIPIHEEIRPDIDALIQFAQEKFSQE